MELTKGKITYVEPDVLQIEKEFVGHWRVHNGEHFAHGFDTKEQARKFAKKNNGTAIAYCKWHNGIVVYTKVEKINEAT